VDSIDRSTTAERAAEAIRQMIWDGTVRPDDRLNQTELAQRLGISRIPLREALLMLAHDGLVRIEPHRGAFVEAYDEQAVQDHYELYGLIDGFALRRALNRASLQERNALFEAMDNVVTALDNASVSSSMRELRDLLHRLGGSPRFRAVAKGLRPILAGDFFQTVEGSSEVTQTWLRNVLDEARAGRISEAVAQYEEMMRQQGSLVANSPIWPK